MMILWILLLCWAACYSRPVKPKTKLQAENPVTQAVNEHIRSLQQQAALIALQATREPNQDKKAKLYAQSTAKALQAARLQAKLK